MNKIEPDFEVIEKERGWLTQYNVERRLYRMAFYDKDKRIFKNWTEWKDAMASFSVDDYISRMNIPETLLPYALKVIDKEQLENYLKENGVLPGGADATLNWLQNYLGKTMNLFIEDTVSNLEKKITNSLTHQEQNNEEN